MTTVEQVEQVQQVEQECKNIEDVADYESDNEVNNEKYQDGKIYKLVNSVDSEIYVGSTTQTLENRLREHMDQSKLSKNQTAKLFMHLTPIGFDKVFIELLETYPCNSNRGLRIREQKWMDELKPSLNTLPAFLTDEQRKEKDAQRHKEYYERNKDKIVAYKAQYAREHSSKIVAKVAAWKKANPEKRKANGRRYYDKHKDALKVHKQAAYCACGGKNGDRTKHERTQKHQDWLARQPQ